MVDPSPPPPGPPAPLATRLADLYAALARAADEAAILTAVAAACGPYGVAELRLAHILCDERGRPREGERIARWPDDPEPARARRVPVAELPLAHLWLRGTGDPITVRDLEADPRVDPATRGRLDVLRAVTIVPLRDERLGAWQGVLFLGWTEPHTPEPEEQFFVGALVRAVTAAVATRRTLQAHADALAETHILYSASAEINQARSIPALLDVLGTAAASHGAARAWLLTVEDDPDARPERGLAAIASLTLEAAWPTPLPPPDPAAGPPRYGVATHPLLDVWQREGLIPVYITDIADDRRFDAASRSVAMVVGVRGIVLLPLAWRGRFAAVAVLGWTGPHAVRLGEQRLYAAVARQAAVVLDNRILLAQARRALDEHSQRRATLETLLDNLPVGVFVNDAATGQHLLRNRAGVALVGDLERHLNAPPRVLHSGTDRPAEPGELTAARAARTARLATGEFDLVRTDGTRVTVDAISVPMFDERGQVARVVSVFQDISERRRADRERARMQDDLVRLQAAALAERGAPLIPVADEILVLPVVGAVDSHRGHLIRETLVALGGRARVRAAILDLTGVRDLDAAAADALLGAARALRLRGVRPILTGLSPGAALALTNLEVDLRDVPIAATLQAAIVQAEALLRRPVPEASP